MSWIEVVAPAVAGGTIGIAGSVVTTLLSHRHERSTRWDSHQAAAVGDFLETAASLEGLHYRRGRSGFKAESNDQMALRQSGCDDALNILNAKAARIRAFVPDLDPSMKRVFDTEHDLRELADIGLPDGSKAPDWRAKRQAHRDAIQAMAKTASRLLGI